MLLVQCANFQDFRFPLRIDVDLRIVAFVVLDNNAFTCCDAFRPNCSSRQSCASTARSFMPVCVHPPVNFLYRRKLSHLSRGVTSYCTESLSSKRSSCICSCCVPRFLFRDAGTVVTANGPSVRSSHSRNLLRSLSESSAGCAVGDLKVLRSGVFEAL